MEKVYICVDEISLDDCDCIDARFFKSPKRDDWCFEKYQGKTHTWTCTRPKGHTGLHHAHTQTDSDGDICLMRWGTPEIKTEPQEPEKEDLTTPTGVLDLF